MVFIIELSVWCHFLCFPLYTAWYKHIPLSVYRSITTFFAFVFINGTNWSSNVKLIMINMIRNNKPLYTILVHSKSMKEMKLKIITMNYIYAHCHESTEPEHDSDSFIDLIDDYYKQRDKCVSDISLPDIRRNSYIIWRNNPSSFSFLSYCAYWNECTEYKSPTKSEWKSMKICYILDFIFNIFAYIVPIFVIIYAKSDSNTSMKTFGTITNVSIVLWSTQLATWIMIYLWMFPFYYNISHFLPYLESRNARDCLYDDVQQNIVDSFDDVYDSLMFDETIGQIINELIHPNIAQEIASFLKVDELSSAVQINDVSELCLTLEQDGNGDIELDVP